MSHLDTSWDGRTNYLLQQNIFFLLLQDYGKIVIRGLDFTRWSGRAIRSFLEQEDAFYLTLENSGKIIIQDPNA